MSILSHNKNDLQRKRSGKCLKPIKSDVRGLRSAERAAGDDRAAKSVTMSFQDPLDLNHTPFSLPDNDTAIVEAFEMAAESFANNHNIPFEKQAFFIEREEKVEEKEETKKNLDLPQLLTKQPQKATYPPPIPMEDDPDRLKLLHSWYWAGYYAGLEDGKKK